MIHLHLQECQSTQEEASRRIALAKEGLLISTQKQTAGRGQRGHSWHFFPGSLAFSFTIKPPASIQLAPLEMGILFCQFINERIKLKWPNDLMLEGKKCGGILCQLIGDWVLVGIGVNIAQTELKSSDNFRFPPGALTWQQERLQKTGPWQFYQFVQNNRKQGIRTIADGFYQYCDHLNQRVSILERKEIRGVFTGLGENGEAVIDDGTQRHKVINGSLLYD